MVIRRRASVVAYVLLSFGACIVALGLVMATSTAASFSRERRHSSAELEAAAQYNADLEAAALPEIVDVLGGVAEQESIASLDPGRCRSAFEGLESVADQGSIYALAPTGEVVCELLATRRAVRDVPGGSWFAEVQTTRQPVYGGIRIEAATGTPQLLVAVPVPTSAGVGVLVAMLDSEIPPLEVPPNTHPATVIIQLDGDRTTVVSTSNGAPVKPGRIPTGSWLREPLGRNHVRTDADGVVRIYEQVALDDPDRIFYAGMARDAALAPARAERDRNLLLAGAILIVVAALGAVVQRRIARPIARLQNAIRVAGDDGSVQADLAGPTEIAALADEFNATMAKRRALEINLAASVARAEDASRMKSLFLANVSHEIRTPMNGVLGMIGLLRDEQLTTKQRDFLATMDDSAAALMAIINDLLDFSKIEAGMVEVDDTDFPLDACVRAAVAPWVPVASEKGIVLLLHADPSLPETVVGDPMRLRQVLSNLVDNAVKFTPEGSVTIRVTPAQGNFVRFEVCDTGIGIGTRSSDELFEAFVQGDPTTTRRFGGTGLGLAICKQLVTLMHGTIGACAGPNGGSVFSFELPLPVGAAASVPSEHHADATPDAGGGRGKVLLAEDNVVNQKVAVALIEQLGFAVDVAPNGRAAVELLEAGDYVAVLMDLQMPVLDGFGATEEIRCRLGSSIPVIALSASVLPEDQARCERVGMNGHLCKPIDRSALSTALHEAATGARARATMPALLA